MVIQVIPPGDSFEFFVVLLDVYRASGDWKVNGLGMFNPGCVQIGLQEDFAARAWCPLSGGFVDIDAGAATSLSSGRIAFDLWTRQGDNVGRARALIEIPSCIDDDLDSAYIDYYLADVETYDTMRRDAG